jgi:hypothetical protein
MPHFMCGVMLRLHPSGPGMPFILAP